MRKDKKLDALLDDVLRDGPTRALESAIRRACAAELAGKRRGRRVRWLIPAAAALLLGLARLIFWLDDRGAIAPIPGPSRDRERAAYVVSTVPLPPALRVETPGMGLPGVMVRTRPDPALVVSTRRWPAATVRESGPAVARITDDEVLDLFPGVAMGFVKEGAGEKKLVFVHPEDAKRFMPRLED